MTYINWIERYYRTLKTRFINTIFCTAKYLVLVVVAYLIVIIPNWQVEAAPSLKLSSRALNVGENGKSLVFLENNVGIGTLEPNAKLDIDAEAADTATNSDPLRFKAGTFVINEHGGIGIGVASDSDEDALKVKGNVVIDGSFSIDANEVDGSSQFSISEQGDIETSGVVDMARPYWMVETKGTSIGDISVYTDDDYVGYLKKYDNPDSSYTAIAVTPLSKGPMVQVRVEGFYLIGFSFYSDTLRPGDIGQIQNRFGVIKSQTKVFKKGRDDKNSTIESTGPWEILDQFHWGGKITYSSMGIHYIEKDKYVSFRKISDWASWTLESVDFTFWGVYMGSSADFLNSYDPTSGFDTNPSY